MLFSDHNGSFPRQHPGAGLVMWVPTQMDSHGKAATPVVFGCGFTRCKRLTMAVYAVQQHSYHKVQ